MKKTLALVLSVLMILSSFGAFAEEPAEETDPVADHIAASAASHPADTSMRFGREPEPFTAEEVEDEQLLVQTILSAVPLSTAKTNPVAMPQVIATVRSSTTDEELMAWKSQGISAVELSLGNDELTYEAAAPIVERLRNFPYGGFEILLATNPALQKDTAIHLALDNRDEEIQKTIDFMALLSSLDIHTMAIAWQPYGISRASTNESVTLHGGSASNVNMNKVAELPIKGERIYTTEEMWETFGYFLDKVLPYCEQYDVRMALHPNDPPQPYQEGVGGLIISADDYRRAFDLANDSPYLGMKLCTGCWSEGGIMFSDNFLADIDEFVRRGKVFEVHFRNVTSPINRDYSGYFEEGLAQDGYMDMYAIIKQFIKSGYDGPIFYDHTVGSELGNYNASYVDNAWIEGLIYAARSELGNELAEEILAKSAE